MSSNLATDSLPDRRDGHGDHEVHAKDCMIRVLHVITGLNVGGAEAMLEKLIGHSDCARFEHVVVSLMDLGVIGERLRIKGVEVHALDGPRGYPTWRVVKGLKALIRQARPTIIQGWMYHGNLAAWVARGFASGAPPLIWGIRQSLGQLGDEKWLTRWVIRMSAMLSARADAVVYNARRSSIQHEAVGFSGQKSIVIPNGFDTEKYRPSPSARTEIRRELGLSGDALLIGLIGRFHPMKDHYGFLQAAGEVARRHGNVHFLLAGDGVSWSNSELSGWASALGLRERIYLLGRRDDVPRLTAALDLAVSASTRNEGFANVIGEAMSCGVPCVVTDVGDSASIVSDTGVVVSPGSATRLAMAICELLELDSGRRERMGRSARARVVAEFSIEQVVARFEALYASISKRQVFPRHSG